MSMIGKTLLQYEISARIGRGGMGEVYQAKDTKLGRDVAIKILPEEFARDADRVARFQREAKLLASLNHPNIAAIYGLEESEGTNFLVMELIEGNTLADRIKTGPIPVEETLKLALQITKGLEAAHEKGVIHRDLKPANIKITPEGRIKVLDFGLAKAFAEDQGEEKPKDSPTLSDAATRKGIILGTAAYMSPEQAKGKSVDKRADIWAFGVILFEMLTGRALFEGEDVTSTLARVLEREPDYSTLAPNLHPRIRFLLERCLEKDAGNRYSSIGDARVEMQKVLADPGGVIVQPIAGFEPRKRNRTTPTWIAAIMLTSIIVGAVIWNVRTPEPRQVMRSEFELPKGQQFIGELTSLAVSPDGSRFIYCTHEGIRIRSLTEFDSRLIPGTEFAIEPCFSPDGQWICYYSITDNQLKKISITGGAPVSLTKISTYPLGCPDWSEDDWIVYAMQGAIMRLPANGGTPETLLKVETDLVITSQILPGGKSVLFTTSEYNSFRVEVQSLDSGERRALFEGDTARYLRTGHIVYMLEKNLCAVAFDPDRLEVKGGPVPLVEGIFQTTAPQYAISQSGTLVYIPGESESGSARTLVWVDREGQEEPVPAQPKDYRTPRISPDGTKVALTVYTEGNTDIWIWDMVRETMTRLTFDEARDQCPLWTPDSRRIVFASGRDNGGVYSKAADGTGEVEKLCSVTDRGLLPWSWSGDGKTLALFESVNLGKYDIGILSMEGDHERTSLLSEEYIEFQPNISPDGKWLAYASMESGKLEIYVRPFPDVDKGRWQISVNGGDTPLWSPDGREIFYLNEDSVMAVPVETEQGFTPGKPEVFFSGPYVPLSLNDGQPWDISPDGKHFLMMKDAGTLAPSAAGLRKIKIVTNWDEELKQRVPVD